MNTSGSTTEKLAILAALPMLTSRGAVAQVSYIEEDRRKVMAADSL